MSVVATDGESIVLPKVFGSVAHHEQPRII
jgi:hypothetical protein